MKKYMCLLIIVILIISSISVTSSVILGNQYYDSNVHVEIGINYGGGFYDDIVCGLQVIVRQDCSITDIVGYLSSTNGKGLAKCGIYDNDFNFVAETQEVLIDKENYVPQEYTFVFDTPPKFFENDIIYIVVYGHIDDSGTVVCYAVDNTDIQVLNEYQNNYPNFLDPFAPLYTDYVVISLYANYDYICPSTNIAVYNNTLHTTGKYATSYSNAYGWLIWLNFTGVVPILTKYENIGYAFGTHESKYTSSDYSFKVWANYTSSLTKSNNIINATGTHFSKWNNGWYIWANYTGILTPLQKFENIINATGNHFLKQNSTGYYIYANYTGNTTNVFLYNNTINSTLTHIKQLKSNGWSVWANSTGNYSSGTNLSKFHIFLNLIGVIGFINWSGNINSTNNNISFNVTANMTINGTANVNNTGVWVYLGAMLTLDNGQFFLLILIGLWSYFIYLYYKEEEVIFTFCIICCGLPLGIILSGVAYYNSYPFGYLISFILILISFLIPTYGMYKKNKAKNKK